ncbi:MAG: GyrI-like domain-containing protein [Actinobacteria bacterium]|nr:GyrI-like domain-containing protein [Actinomycetota bacterium]
MATPMEVEIVEIAAVRVAGISHRGAYGRIPEAFVRLFPKAEELGLARADGAAFAALYFDDPRVIPEQSLRSLAAVTVAQDAMIGDLEEAWLPSGRYLRAVFYGPHSGLPDAWARLGDHLADGAYPRRKGLSFNIYVSNEPEVLPEQVRTDIYLPIA